MRNGRLLVSRFFHARPIGCPRADCPHHLDPSPVLQPKGLAHRLIAEMQAVSPLHRKIYATLLLSCVDLDGIVYVGANECFRLAAGSFLIYQVLK